MHLSLPSRNLPRRTVGKMLASLIPEVAGFAIAGLFAYIGIGIQLKIVVGTVLLAIIFALIAEYYLTFKPIIAFRGKQISTFMREYLSMVENDLSSSLPSDVSARANVMLEKSGGIFGSDYLSIDYVSDEGLYDDEEIDLPWDIGQGCCGGVIHQNQQLVAVSPGYTDTWDAAWGTTDRQNRVTGHLNTIIGTPIYRPSDEEKRHPIGVFVIDSEESVAEVFDVDPDTDIAEIDFRDTELANEAIRHAKNIGVLL